MPQDDLSPVETFQSGLDVESPEFRRKLNAVAAWANAISKLRVEGAPYSVSPGGIQIGAPYSRGGEGVASTLLGEIVVTGPNAEADFSDERYWVKILDIDEGVDPMPDERETVEATNVCEIAEGTHSVRKEGGGDLRVEVFEAVDPDTGDKKYYFSRLPNRVFPASWTDASLAFSEESSWADPFSARTGTATEVNGRTWSVSGDQAIIREEGAADFKVDLRNTGVGSPKSVPAGSGCTADSTSYDRDTDQVGLSIQVGTHLCSPTPGTLRLIGRTVVADPNGDMRTVAGEALLQEVTGFAEDKLVAVNAGDTPDYLDQQISAGSNISIATVGGALQISATDTNDDEKVALGSVNTPTDTPAYLNEQLVAGTGINFIDDGDTITIENAGSGANNQVAVKSGCSPDFLDAVLNVGPASGGGANANGDQWITEHQEGVGGCTLVLRHADPQTGSVTTVTADSLSIRQGGGVDEFYLRLNTRAVTHDDKGHVTGTSSGASELALELVEVVTDLQVSGTDLQMKTQEIFVLKARTESGWTTWHPGTACP